MSSLNPNEVHPQTGLSTQGANKIAQMLRHIMTARDPAQGFLYRFYSDFFTANQENNYYHIEQDMISSQWKPAHPDDLKVGYTYEEERLYPKYKDLDPDELLRKLDKKAAALTSPILHEPIKKLLDEGDHFLKSNPRDENDNEKKRFKMSIILAINLVEKSKGSNMEHFQKAIDLLKANAEHRAIGKAGTRWLKLKTALLALVVAATILIAIFLPMATPIAIGLGAGAALLVGAPGVRFFNHNKPKLLAQASLDLADKAKSQLKSTPRRA